MKRFIFAAMIFLVTPVWAVTSVVQVTRHDGNGTGKALETLTGTNESTMLGTCKTNVKKATRATPRVLSTCKVQFADTFEEPVVVTTPPVTNPPVTTPTTTSSLPPIVPPAGAIVYYFSDCQAGAATGCVPGSNANAGTSASAPKQNLSGFDISNLPAGSQLLFARGGAWTNVNLSVRNLNATSAAPLVFDAYGTGNKPVLMTAVNNAVNFGNYNDTVQDGGYTFRNLKFDGRGTAMWGFFLMGATRNVLLENNEITGFQIGLHAQNMAAGNEALVIRGNDIHHNAEMGILGDANNLIIEDNLIRENNFSGSGFNHGLYLGGHATNGIVRNNRFVNNSAVNGVCMGGNLTVHGQWNGLLIEGNTITQVAATAGCWGISINDGYSSPEFFRNVTVRNNETVNVECAICVRAAPGIVIANNKMRSNQPQLPSGIVINPPNGSDDDPGVGPVVRDNVVCFNAPNPGYTKAVNIAVAGASDTGTVYQTGSASTTGACASQP